MGLGRTRTGKSGKPERRGCPGRPPASQPATPPVSARQENVRIVKNSKWVREKAGTAETFRTLKHSAKVGFKLQQITRRQMAVYLLN